MSEGWSNWRRIDTVHLGVVLCTQVTGYLPNRGGIKLIWQLNICTWMLSKRHQITQVLDLKRVTLAREFYQALVSFYFNRNVGLRQYVWDFFHQPCEKIFQISGMSSLIWSKSSDVWLSCSHPSLWTRSSTLPFRPLIPTICLTIWYDALRGSALILWFD